MGNVAAQLRPESEHHFPPPDYEPYSDRVTLTIHSGGRIKNGRYITGDSNPNIVMYDHVLVKELGVEAMKKFGGYLYVGKEFSVYIQIGNYLRFVRDDSIVKEACDSLSNERELKVYIVDKDSDFHEFDGEGEYIENSSSIDLSEFTDSDDEPYEYNMREDEDATEDEVDNVFEKNKRDMVVYRGKRTKKVSVEVQNDCSGGDIDIDVQAGGDDLDSNKGSDDDDLQGRLTFPTFNTDHIFNPYFELGMTFSSKKEMKLAIQSYAVNEKRSVKFVKNDKRRLYAKCCDPDCSWILRGLCVDKGACFRIRELKSNHSCKQSTDVGNVSSTWLAKRFKDRFINDPDRNMNAFRVETVSELKVHVTKHQAYRTKYQAVKLIEGQPTKQYELLWSFGEEIKRSNPGTTFIIETDGSDSRNRFDRLYICLHTAKEGFIHGCRPIICLDGCWLKGIHGGMLLTACGIDGNNSYLPIAFAVVSKENTEIWSWFMTLLKEDLKIVDTSSFTIMSDKQKGLIQAEHDVFPGAEYRFCARHLLANFRQAGFKGPTFKHHFWKAARCTTVNSFEKVMDDIHKIDPKAVEWLRDRPPNQWCKAFFREFPRCDVLTNNACETLNANILSARKKPILSMLQELHSYMMQRFVKNRDTAAKSSIWKEVICPRIQGIIDLQARKIPDYLPIRSDDDNYQVNSIQNPNLMWSVDLKNGVCGCRQWQLSGIPCIHALVAITFKRSEVEPYIHKSYYVESYKKIYKLPVLPINSVDEWPKISMIPMIPPVAVNRKRGRPITKRRLEAGEQGEKVRKTKINANPILPGGEKIRRNQHTVKCSKCQNFGHNARTCKGKNLNMIKEASHSSILNVPADFFDGVVHEGNEVEETINLGDEDNGEGMALVARFNDEREETLLESMIQVSGPSPTQFEHSQPSLNMLVPPTFNPAKSYTSTIDMVRPMPSMIRDGQRYLSLAAIVQKAKPGKGLKKKKK